MPGHPGTLRSRAVGLTMTVVSAVTAAMLVSGCREILDRASPVEVAGTTAAIGSPDPGEDAASLLGDHPSGTAGSEGLGVALDDASAAIAGRLVDAVTGLPIRDAGVALLGLDRRTVSGPDGGFRFDRVQSGPVTLVLGPADDYVPRGVDEQAAAGLTDLGILPMPRKFKIINTTGGYQIEYFHADIDGDSLPSVNERILFFERDVEGKFSIFTWQLLLLLSEEGQTPYEFTGGEVLNLTSKFPFNKFDRFRFQTETQEVSTARATNDLSNVIVYPNPYIAAHEFEPGLPPSVTSGRGERRMYFTNLPMDSKIYIFTSRGDLVRTLESGSSLNNGTVIWDLKTRENLDVAFGVYFYVVESEVGVKRGKLAIIK